MMFSISDVLPLLTFAAFLSFSHQKNLKSDCTTAKNGSVLPSLNRRGVNELNCFELKVSGFGRWTCSDVARLTLWGLKTLKWDICKSFVQKCLCVGVKKQNKKDLIEIYIQDTRLDLEFRWKKVFFFYFIFLFWRANQNPREPCKQKQIWIQASSEEISILKLI